MIDQLPKDVPAIKTSSGAGRNSSSATDKASSGFSDVVANMSASDKGSVNKPPGSVNRIESTKGSVGKTGNGHADISSAVSGVSKPTNTNAADVTSGIQLAEGKLVPGAETVDRTVVASQHLFTQPTTDPLGEPPGKSVTGEPMPNIDNADTQAVTDALPLAEEIALQKPPNATVVQQLNRSGEMGSKQSIDKSVSTSISTARDRAPVTVVGGPAFATLEKPVTLISARQLDSAGASVVSTAALPALTDTEAANDKQLGVPENSSIKKAVILRQVESQKELTAILKDSVEAKTSALAKINGLATLGDNVPEVGAGREHSVVASLTTNDQLSDRLGVLKTTGQGAAVDGRQQTAVQYQSLNNLRFMIEQGQRAATIQLHPAELGALKIGIDIQSEHLNVHINAAQSLTREALELLLPKMRAQLMQQGYSDVDITLSGGQSEEQSSNHQQGFEQHFTADSGNDGDVSLQQVGVATDASMQPVGKKGGSNLVDLFA